MMEGDDAVGGVAAVAMVILLAGAVGLGRSNMGRLPPFCLRGAVSSGSGGAGELAPCPAAGDGDALRLQPLGLGDDERQHAVVDARRDGVGVDALRQAQAALEGAEGAL